ncbi:hypothetical protein P4K82_13235 [Bacillus cereus]|nr:hypothetical protein [Bacillus cereus]
MLRLTYVTTFCYKKNEENTVKMQLQESLYVGLKNAIRCHYNELITRFIGICVTDSSNVTMFESARLLNTLKA